MKRTIYFFVTVALMLTCSTTQAQVLNRIARSAHNAAENAAERAVTRKVEEKVEDEVNKAFDKAFETGEKAEKDAKEAKAQEAKASTAEPAYTGPIKGGPVNANKFPFTQGSYVQAATALGIETKTTVYFSHSGEWRAEEIKYEARPFRPKVDKLKITKGNKFWDLDLLDKRGAFYEVDTTPGSAEAALVVAMGGSAADGMEITELGTENCIGYVCRKFRVIYPDSDMDVICWSYGTLLMKSEGRIGPMKIATRIISIELSAPPASKFEVPAGVKIENL